MLDKMDLIIQRIEDLKENTNSRLDSIDVNLGEHMRRTDALENLHKDNLTRIERLEEPGKVKEYLKKKVLVLAAICGAIIGILKAYDMLKVYL